MQFATVANALTEAHAAARAGNTPAQIELVRSLLAEAADAQTAEQLLRVLLPSEDRDRVYGMKTLRLMRVFARALDKAGRPDLAAQLRKWAPSPHAGTLLRQPSFVCTPEVDLTLHAQLVLRPPHAQPATLADVCAACDELTGVYLRRNRAEDAVADLERGEVFAELLQTGALGATTWLVFLRMLLKRVSMGIGFATVLQGLASPKLPAPMAFYARQRSLRALAEACMLPEGQQARVELVCGTPFIPMTAGHSLRAPYLFKWVFSREERLQHPITPHDGRLVVIIDRTRVPNQEVWFAPLNAAAKMRMVDIDEPRALQKSTRKRHILLLHAFRRARLLAMDRCEGLVLHYTLSAEGHGRIVFLLRDVTDAREGGVELAGEERLVLPDEPPQPFHDLERAEFLRTLLHKPSAQDPNASEIAHAAVGQKREGHRLQVVVAGRAEVPRRRRRPPAGGNAEQQQGVIAQLKLDGDRMQAHISLDAATQQGRARLFTRNGYEVTTLYSDVSEELKRHARALAPCILDGELVAVDAGGTPLPWDNAKWRFNGLHARAEHLEQAEEEEAEAFMVDYGETLANNERWEDGSGGAEGDMVTFVPAANAGRWRRSALRPLLPRGSHLRFVVFDLLMVHGEDVSAVGCRARWDRLNGEVRAVLEARVGGLAPRFVSILADVHRVRNATELLGLIRRSAQQRTEGYMLKDPSAPYAFGPSAALQKVKLAGPDVNAAVIGIGFSLSTSPRRWGIGTSVLASAEASFDALAYYCRTEVLEGDAMHRAFQVIYRLRSRVRTLHVLQAKVGDTIVCQNYRHRRFKDPSNNNNEEEEAHVNDDDNSKDFYRCVVKSKTPQTLVVEWRRGGLVEGTVSFPNANYAVFADLQWLCSPWECPFALSLHGDLRPLDGGAPRHPVGRVEFTLWQASPTWDSPVTIAHKFEEAQEQNTCVEMHALHRIRRLRALPPETDHLTEVRRIVLGWLSCSQRPPPPPAAGQPEQQQQEEEEEENENWPQLPPAGFITAQAFTHELRRLRARLHDAMGIPEAQNNNPNLRELLKTALRDVDPQECLAIASLPAQSQWTRYDRAMQQKQQQQQQQHNNSSREEEDEDEDDAQQAVLNQNPQICAERIARLKAIKDNAALGRGILTGGWTPAHMQQHAAGPLIIIADAANNNAGVLHDSDYVFY